MSSSPPSPEKPSDLNAHSSSPTETLEPSDHNITSSPPASPKGASKPDPPSLAKSLEDKKIASLQAKIESLEIRIKETAAKREEVDGKLKDKDAQGTVKAHIKLLHDYNEIRDIGQGLMGIVADTRGVRVRDVYNDFDVGEGD